MCKFRNFFALFLILIFTISFGQVDERVKPLIKEIVECDSDTARISLLIQIAEEYKYNNFEKMLDYCRNAYQLSYDIGDDAYIGRSTINVANAHLYLRDFDSSQFYINKERNRIMSLNDSLLIAELFLLQGTIFRNKYNFIESKENLRNCLLYTGNKNYKTKANAYNNLGVIHRQHGMPDSALTFYIQAQKYFEHLNDTEGLVKILVNIGKVYFSMKEYDKAKKYYLNALDIVMGLDNLDYKSAVYQNLGTVYRISEDFSEALQYYNKALEIAELVNNEIDMGDINNNIGDVYFMQGQYNDALKYFEKSAQNFKNLDYYPGELTAKNNIALVYSKKNNHSKTLLMLDTVLQIAKKNDLTEKILMSYNSIAMELYLSGNHRRAYDTLRKWIALNDSIFNLEKAKEIKTLELKYEKEKNEAKILALRNETLQKDLEIKQKTNQQNLILSGGFAAIIILSFLFFLHRQKSRKNRIINEKEISRLKEEKKALAAQSIVQGQEEERKRIARELHDGLGVLLSNVKMQFSSFMDKSAGNKELLSKAANVLNQASVDVRRISHDMMPGNLNKFGLVAAIEDLFEEISRSGKIKAEIKTTLAEERFAENKEIMLYRIVQELVNNTIKHAKPQAFLLN